LLISHSDGPRSIMGNVEVDACGPAARGTFSMSKQNRGANHSEGIHPGGEKGIAEAVLMACWAVIPVSMWKWTFV